jgi:DNA-binding response OmpR family regulator
MTRRPRAEKPGPDRLLPAGLAIDEGRRRVEVDGVAVELTAVEFDLLAALARDPGRVLRRGALLDRIWGEGFVADDHLVDVHIANLRRRLGDDANAPRFIETVRGIGYRLHAGS